MATLINTVFIFIISTVLISCNLDKEESIQDDSIEKQILGNTTTLISTQNGCIIKYASKKIDLKLPTPCRFALSPNLEDVKLESFQSGDLSTKVFIVIGGTVEKDPNTPVTLREDCGHTWKGILLSQGDASISPRVATGIACAKVGIDRVEYELFFKHH